METLESRIKDCHLTNSFRQIAEFCLQNKHSLPLLSSADIAKQVGVSDVSVIRFVKALGYENFYNFKQAIQEEIANVSVLSTASSPIVHYVYNHGDDRTDPTSENHKAAYFQIIEDIFTKNPPDVFDQAAKIILGSRNRYVLGIRFRNSVAEICANLLRMTTPNVIHIPAADYAAFQYALDFSRDDCLIWFCFGRHTNFEKQMLNYVRQSGIKMIIISDERVSRAALESDLFIQSCGHIATPFYSSVGNCIIAEQIALASIGIGWIGAENRLKDFEAGLSTTTISQES